MLSKGQKKFFETPDTPHTENCSSPIRDAQDMTADNMIHPKGPAEEVHSVATDNLPNEKAQDGVTQAEAITLTWTRSSLAAAYIL